MTSAAGYSDAAAASAHSPATPQPEPVHDEAAQRRAFTVVYMIELWERFGFYGMAALMVLYMVQYYGFADDHANLAWGAISALVYTGPVLGGWAADRWLGARRAMLVGAVVLFFGYLGLALPFSGLPSLYLSLALVVAGNGLFKPNSGTLVRRIYENQPSRIDSAFTLYYMAVNVGSTFSMFGTPWVKEHWGWHAAFAVCCVGLALGVLNYLLLRRAMTWVGTACDEAPLPLRSWGALAVVTVLGVFAVAWVLRDIRVASACMTLALLATGVVYAVRVWQAPAQERAGLIVAAVLLLQTGVFMLFYQQMSTSLTLFALHNVEPDLNFFGAFSITLMPAQFQALNPVAIMLFSPVLAWGYNRLARGRGDVSIAFKFTLGFACVAVAFVIYGASGSFATAGRVSAWFMVGGYALLSLGELLVSGLGLAVLAHYVPARMSGFMTGAYFGVVAAAMYLGSVMANLAAASVGKVQSVEQSLGAYLHLFGVLAVIALAATVVSLALVPWLRRVAQATKTAAS